MITSLFEYFDIIYNKIIEYRDMSCMYNYP